MRNVLSRHLLLATMAASLGALAAGCGNSSSGDSGSSSEHVVAVDRPPQFVMLAFDGSLNLGFWEESRQFAKTNGNLKFTYFASGVYFLADAKHAMYTGPHHSAGHSDIGFGGVASDIPLRVAQVRQAVAEGHEMASHANGHFDGTTWTSEDWAKEFDLFEKLMLHTGENNGVDTGDIGFTLTDVVGFRAPLLGNGPGLYTELAAAGYKYDTSKSNAANYWPEKKNGVWNFPLAQLKIVGSGKGTLSMDYNFYVADSRGVKDAANKATYKKQMIDTYMKYFQGNYFGNRAPVNIGHHFSKWNGGAYWEAMQEFANNVCGLPEVKCVTYKEYMAWIDQHEGDIAHYKAKEFNVMAHPPSAQVEDPPAAVAEGDYEAAGFVSESSDSHSEDDGE